MLESTLRAAALAAVPAVGRRPSRRRLAWLSVVALVGGFVGAVGPATPSSAVDEYGASEIYFYVYSDTVYGEGALLAADLTDVSTSCEVFHDCFPPPGRVDFMEGATRLAYGYTSSEDTGRTTTARAEYCCLAPGRHTIRAVFVSDFFLDSSAQYMTTVRPSPVSGSVVQSLNSTAQHQSVTFTASVVGDPPGSFPPSPLAALPSGRVTFYDGSQPIGTVDLAGGRASLSTSSLSPGGHTISAFFPGDGNYVSQSLGFLDHTVTNPSTGTVLTITPSDVLVGESVTYEAVVTGEGATATGDVEIRLHDALVRMLRLDATGRASFTALAPAYAGTFTYTARYNGDGSHNASSADATLMVRAKPTQTQLRITPSPSSYGEDVTLAAIVVSNFVPMTTGTVRFVVDGTELAPAEALDNGYAHLTVPALAVGAHTVSAYYSGDSAYGRSERSTTHTVEPAASSIVMASAPNPSHSGDSMMLTATVSVPAASGPPTGIAYLVLDDAEVATPAELDAAGVATYALVLDDVRDHTFSVYYFGDTNHTASAATAIHTVIPAVTSVAIFSASNPTVVGQPVTVTATVSGGGSTAPRGTVTFFDGTIELGSQPVGPDGATSLTTAEMAVADHQLVAVYGGDATHAASQASIRHTVLASETMVAMASTPNPSFVGQHMTLTATVTTAEQSAGPPTGTITFLDGTTELGTASVGTDGAAISHTTALAAGDHTVTARYGGDANHRPSETSTSHTVNKHSTTLVAEPAIMRLSGLRLTLRMAATMTDAAGNPTAGQSVRFVVAGNTVCSATTNVQGHVVCTSGGWWLLAVINGGYTAHYDGNATYLPSADRAGIFQT